MLEADQKFEAIFGSDMRALSAILGLLLCLIAARSDELPVIKDWEAIHYVGKNVEVRGFVVSGFPRSDSYHQSLTPAGNIPGRSSQARRAAFVKATEFDDALVDDAAKALT